MVPHGQVCRVLCQTQGIEISDDPMSEQRDAYYDNARLLLIGLVITGHLMDGYRLDHPLWFDLYNAVYFIHMPAFALVSGVFARRIHGGNELRILAARLLIPYLVFQVAYTGYMALLGLEPLSLAHLIIPQYTLWYLVSLLCWYAMLPIAMRIPNPFLGAIGASLIVGAIPAVGLHLSLSRTFVFFPFFLLGHLLGPKRLQILCRPSARCGGALFLVLLVLSVICWVPVQAQDWLLGTSSYRDLHVSALAGVLIRLGITTASTLGAVALLAVVPTRRFYLTSFGSRTLSIYLLHGFLVKGLAEAGLVDPLVAQGHVWVVPVIALLLILLLGNARVTSLMSPLIELRPSLPETANASTPSTHHLHLRKM